MNAAVGAAVTGGAVAAAIAARQNAMLAELKEKGAVSADKAIRYDPPKKGDDKIFAGLVNRDLVGTVGEDRFFLTEKGLAKGTTANTSGGAWVLFLLATAMIVASVVALIVVLD
ncbi:hypothetical protein WJT74_08835 [Sphingomicrobium sp. XHP0239]|uniref:hypothetical protein n=1 Tax=Sphingomicrobium maritimum TaxID=3133972 RepID=UPI0031CC8274